MNLKTAHDAGLNWASQQQSLAQVDEAVIQAAFRKWAQNQGIYGTPNIFLWDAWEQAVEETKRFISFEQYIPEGEPAYQYA